MSQTTYRRNRWLSTKNYDRARLPVGTHHALFSVAQYPTQTEIGWIENSGVIIRGTHYDAIPEKYTHFFIVRTPPIKFD